MNQQIIDQWKLAERNAKESAKKADSLKAPLVSNIVSMIKWMYDTEKWEIRSFEKDKNVPYELQKSLYPRPDSYYLPDPKVKMENVKIKGDMLHVRYYRSYSRCGDYEEVWHKIKIPLVYFTMSYEERKATHVSFSQSRINKIASDVLKNHPDRGKFLTQELGIASK